MMVSECYHIVLMQVEEFLFVVGFILHHAKGSSCVHDSASSASVLQVPTSVMASKPMSMFEAEVTTRSLG